MPIETLEELLKDPRLQAALASECWSDQDAEVTLSAVERSGLSVREFAKRTKVGGASRLYSRRWRQQLKDAQPMAPATSAKRQAPERADLITPAAATQVEPPTQFVQLTVQPTEPHAESQPALPPAARPSASMPTPAPSPTSSSTARPLGLKVRFCRAACASPEAADTVELEILFPPC